MGLEEAAPQQRRYYLSIARLAAVIVGTSAATALAMGLWLLRINGAFDPDPALIRSAGLGRGDVDAVSNRFDIAVRTQFPMGLRESEMINELVREKFKPDWSGHRATYRSTGLVCVNEYSVSWAVDEADRLTRIFGEFRALCW